MDALSSPIELSVAHLGELLVHYPSLLSSWEFGVCLGLAVERKGSERTVPSWLTSIVNPAGWDALTDSQDIPTAVMAGFLIGSSQGGAVELRATYPALIPSLTVMEQRRAGLKLLLEELIGDAQRGVQALPIPLTHSRIHSPLSASLPRASLWVSCLCESL